MMVSRRLFFAIRRAVLPLMVKTMIALPKISSQIYRAAFAAACMAGVSSASVKYPLFSPICDSSAARVILCIMRTVSIGYFPLAVSPESMTASVPSYTALATSDASARVGVGCSVIDSSICVAVITILFCLAAHDHDAIGRVNNVVALFNGFGFFNLGDYLDVLSRARDNCLHFSDIIRGTDKRKGHIVHVVPYAKSKVDPVLAGDRWLAHPDPRQVDALVV